MKLLVLLILVASRAAVAFVLPHAIVLKQHSMSVHNTENSSNAVTIRELTCDDQEMIWTLLMHAAHETTVTAVQSQSVLAQYGIDFGRTSDIGVAAAVTDDVVVGAAWCRYLPNGFAYNVNNDDNMPELAIAVLPEYRGQGIGKKLLQTVIAKLSNSNATGITLSCRQDNVHAMGLYKQLGFVSIPESKTQNREGGSSVTMTLKFLKK